MFVCRLRQPSASASEIAAAVRAELTAELSKIQQLAFAVPNRVDSTGNSLVWNGSTWVPL